MVAKVTAEIELRDGWLKDDVKRFVSRREVKNECPFRNVQRWGLHITHPPAKYLLAMKVMACRRLLPDYADDYQDIATLLRVTKLSSVDAIEQTVRMFVPEVVIPEAVCITLTKLLAANETNTVPPPKPSTDGTRSSTRRQLR